MKKCNIIFIAAATLMASPGAFADYAASNPVYGTISPAYRTGDLHNFDGEEMVRVTQITAMDQDGQSVVLFSDKAGAILPRAELKNVGMLINPKRENWGEYHDPIVQLNDEVLILDRGRITKKTLPEGLGGTTLKSAGRVNVSEYEVTSTGLSF